jgi:hypothetical protein
MTVGKIFLTKNAYSTDSGTDSGTTVPLLVTAIILAVTTDISYLLLQEVQTKEQSS